MISYHKTVFSSNTKNQVNSFLKAPFPGIILCMATANGRRRYTVTSSLIGWAHTQNDPCFPHHFDNVSPLADATSTEGKEPYDIVIKLQKIPVISVKSHCLLR